MTQSAEDIKAEINEADKQLKELEQLERNVKDLRTRKTNCHFYDSQGFWMLVAAICLLIIALHNNVQ